jgi:hypothetical protein
MNFEINNYKFREEIIVKILEFCIFLDNKKPDFN